MTEMNTDALTPREECLERARSLICGEREAQYGKPAESLARIARLWSAYTGLTLFAEDVCAMMVLLKIARTQGPGSKPDNWIDQAGYVALAYEVSQASEGDKD